MVSDEVCRAHDLLGALLSWRFLERAMPARLVGYVAAATGVGIIALRIGAVLGHRRVGGLAMLNLLVVLPTAGRFGRGPAVFACVAASVTYDWASLRGSRRATRATRAS